MNPKIESQLADATAANGRDTMTTDPRSARSEARLEILWQRVLAMNALLAEHGLARTCEIGAPHAELCSVEIKRSPTSRTLVFAFAGIQQRMSMPPSEFVATLSAFDVDVVFVKDIQQCWYQKGLPGISTDVPSTVDHLRTFISSHINRVVTIGTSAGGFAAILFGVLMRADAILALAPQAVVNRRVFESFKTSQTTWANVNRNPEYMRLPDLLRNADYSGRIEVHYGRGMSLDERAARQLAVTETVKLVPHDFDKHAIANHLRKTGQLSALISDLIG